MNNIFVEATHTCPSDSALLRQFTFTDAFLVNKSMKTQTLDHRPSQPYLLTRLQVVGDHSGGKSQSYTLNFRPRKSKPKIQRNKTKCTLYTDGFLSIVCNPCHCEWWTCSPQGHTNATRSDYLLVINVKTLTSFYGLSLEHALRLRFRREHRT